MKEPKKILTFVLADSQISTLKIMGRGNRSRGLTKIVEETAPARLGEALTMRMALGLHPGKDRSETSALLPQSVIDKLRAIREASDLSLPEVISLAIDYHRLRDPGLAPTPTTTPTPTAWSAPTATAWSAPTTACADPTEWDDEDPDPTP